MSALDTPDDGMVEFTLALQPTATEADGGPWGRPDHGYQRWILSTPINGFDSLIELSWPDPTCGVASKVYGEVGGRPATILAHLAGVAAIESFFSDRGYAVIRRRPSARPRPVESSDDDCLESFRLVAS